MRISDYVHQIRIDFQVTPEVQRYVFVYLLVGEKCCLIDAGVAGSEAVISAYMKKLGRDISEIKALFLTHAHPDHMGAAAAIKEMSGCEVYASEKERRWRLLVIPTDPCPGCGRNRSFYFVAMLSQRQMMCPFLRTL